MEVVNAAADSIRFIRGCRVAVVVCSTLSKHVPNERRGLGCWPVAVVPGGVSQGLLKFVCIVGVTSLCHRSV